MATPTREEVVAALGRLPPEQHKAFLAEVERRLAVKAPSGPPGPRDPAFYGDPNDPQSMMEAGRHSGTADAALPSAVVLAGASGMGLAGQLGVRAVGGFTGGSLGYRKAGVPGMLGGAAIGVMAPGLTAATDVGDMVAGSRGGAAGFATALTLKTLLGGKGAVLGKVLEFLGRAEKAKGVAGAGELTAGEMRTIVANMGRPGAGWVANPSVEEVAAKMVPAAAKAAPKTIGDMMTKAPILPAGKRAMATNLGGVAKAGSPATAADDIEAALKASIEANADKGLSLKRIMVGAENVGKKLGMTKEEIREIAGPVVGEAHGAASPVFPQKTFNDIYDKMLAMPKAGRPAYAAAAKGEKAMSQVETIRRVFERAGMAVSAAAIGDAIRRREES